MARPEPINPEAWTWYHRMVGKEKLPIVTLVVDRIGAAMMSPLPGGPTIAFSRIPITIRRRTRTV